MTQSNDNRIVANIVPGSTPIHSTVQSKDKPIQSTVGIAPSATTERKGIIRIATKEEALAGVLNNAAITPYTLELKTTTFVFEQAVSATTWVILHNLNKEPSVFVVDTTGKVQIPNEIIYDNENQVTVQFISEFAGKAYLN